MIKLKDIIKEDKAGEYEKLRKNFEKTQLTIKNLIW